VLPVASGKKWRVSLSIAFAVFPVIFIGELPDKTMMASLVMATRGKPLFVWVGAATAFLVHVVIATTIGVALFRVLPSRVLDALVAVMFVVGGVYALKEATPDEEALIDREIASHTVVTTAFLVIFVAEWGDLTQILTANLAAHYHSGLSVGVGAVTALWAVAALAVLGGQGLLRYVNVSTVRKITAGVLFVFAAVAVFQAVR
jgi:Ca2+/H+ antiporter, TMEM165/GDT1 family